VPARYDKVTSRDVHRPDPGKPALSMATGPIITFKKIYHVLIK
jgi:hypothetical protein